MIDDYKSGLSEDIPLDRPDHAKQQHLQFWGELLIVMVLKWMKDIESISNCFRGEKKKKEEAMFLKSYTFKFPTD